MLSSKLAATVPCPGAVHELVERFAAHIESYKRTTYNETQVRREFIDPFFTALGWDVDNKAGHAEAYKDVIHEDALKVKGATKAPDYCFRIGGVRKFFVEAKKPSRSVKDDAAPAYQVRRYAWTAKLPLSIVTDFEEFAVYDCRIKPKAADKPSAGRVLYITYDEYGDRWGEIASIFAKDAILKGSFDKYAESNRRKRGTAEVDTEFLREIEAWRETLARNVALRNYDLSVRDLNYAVGKTIDRIIFLRMCEDRGIEPYAQLRDLLKGEGVYKRLLERFHRADERYNSGLFHFEREKGRAEDPDELTPRLTIDDKVLKDIIKRLYYPDSPYEFSVLPAEILGQVYEQFLGKVIRLSGRRAIVEDKPEVKKAGGVYYTPAYIVDYIVEHTVGELLKEAGTPTKASRLRILDPACGSGSFLLGAYQYLLDWHLRWYTENEPEKLLRKKRPPVYRSSAADGKGGVAAWRLTVAERKRILLNNIFGVDIDPQAVEVTKLSLLLKVLEGESKESLDNQLRLFHAERALPDLGGNIKCGNSLIGPDFYDNQQLPLLDEEERYRINVFDWQAEFGEIMRAGGFDAVIGNPPYVLLQDEFRDDLQLKYFRSNFRCATYKLDTYHLFMERAILLTKLNGMASMITPANFLTNNHLEALRRFLLDETDIYGIVLIEGGVFNGISVDNAIWIVKREATSAPSIRIVHGRPEVTGISIESEYHLSKKGVLADPHVLFTGSKSDKGSNLWDHCVRGSDPLGQIAHVNFGKQLRNRKIHSRDVIKVKGIPGIPPNYRPCYTGRDVQRYMLQWNQLACLNDRIAQSGGCWDEKKQDSRFKLLTRQIGNYPVFAIDENGHQCLNTIFMINVKNDTVDPRYVLGLLNSKLISALWLDRFYDRRRTFPKIKGTYLKELPIQNRESGDVEHNRLVDLVQRMLDLHKQLGSANTPSDKTAIQRQIDATDQQIDRLVYELYGLTEDEIKIVEEATQG